MMITKNKIYQRACVSAMSKMAPFIKIALRTIFILILYILITAFQLLLKTTANNKTISSLKDDLMIFLSSGKNNLFPLNFEKLFLQ